MNVSISAAINTAYPSSSPVAPVVSNYSAAHSMPGDLVSYRNSEPSVVRNTPAERKSIRKALGSKLPKFHFWSGYIGEVNKALGVKHYWEIPSARIPEALNVIDSMFKQAPVFPSFSQDEPAPVIPEHWEDAKYELMGVLNQFQTYQKWFKKQADLMEYAAASVSKVLSKLE